MSKLASNGVGTPITINRLLINDANLISSMRISLR